MACHKVTQVMTSVKVDNYLFIYKKSVYNAIVSLSTKYKSVKLLPQNKNGCDLNFGLGLSLSSPTWSEEKSRSIKA